MTKDSELLEKFDHRLMNMRRSSPRHRQRLSDRLASHQKTASYFKRILRPDVGVRQNTEEDENHFFTKNQTKYFGTLSDRAERLKAKQYTL